MPPDLNNNQVPLFGTEGTFLDMAHGSVMGGLLGAGIGSSIGAAVGGQSGALVGGGVGALVFASPLGREMIKKPYKMLSEHRAAVREAKRAAGAGEAGLAGLGGRLTGLANKYSPFLINKMKAAGFNGADFGLAAGGMAINTVRTGLGLFENSALAATNILAGSFNPFNSEGRAHTLEDIPSILFPGRNNPNIFKGMSKHDISKHLDMEKEGAETFFESIREHKGFAQISKEELKSSSFLKNAEEFEKKILNGNIGGRNAIGTAAFDTRRFGLNRRIIGRLTAGVAVSSIGGALLGSMGNNSPAPSVYFDGVNMRHINDMGADASYARSIVGRGSRM
jgi:hypothetical protein